MLELLPKQFDFYHLGTVQQMPDREDFSGLLIQSRSGVRFGCLGEARVWIFVLFGKDLDFSTYSELGNVIASQLANQLSVKTGTTWMITAPQKISPEQMDQLYALSLEPGKLSGLRSYLHSLEDRSIPVQVILQHADPQEIGNA